MSDAISGAIVGGVIGLVSGLAVAVLSIVWAYRHDQFRRKLTAHHDYLAWLRGLAPECELIISTLDQLQPQYATITPKSFHCPTKRLNSDFLAAARLGVMKHARAYRLFPTLTTAYRDVVHTNDMMARFEARYREVLGEPDPWNAVQGILGPTTACLPSVRKSIETLLAAAREQETLEMDNPPRLWMLD